MIILPKQMRLRFLIAVNHVHRVSNLYLSRDNWPHTCSPLIFFIIWQIFCINIFSTLIIIWHDLSIIGIKVKQIMKIKQTVPIIAEYQFSLHCSTVYRPLHHILCIKTLQPTKKMTSYPSPLVILKYNIAEG